MMRWKVASTAVAVWTLLASAAATPFARASDDPQPGQFVIRRGKAAISAIFIEALPSRLETREDEPTLEHPRIWIHGRLKKTDLSLLINMEAVEVDSETGRFEHPIDLYQQTTTVPVTVVRENGSVLQESLSITSLQWQSVNRAAKPIQRGSWRLIAGLSGDLLQYRQTNIADFDQLALAAKISVSKSFPGSSWYLDANSYGTVVGLQTTLPDSLLRTIGVNMRAGRLLFRIADSASVWAQGGMFYVWAASPNFGYSLFGPQLNPQLTVQLGSVGRLGTYFKFAPLGGFNPSNREIAGGIGFSRTPSRGAGWGIGIDYSHLKKTADTITLEATHWLLGISLIF